MEDDSGIQLPRTGESSTKMIFNRGSAEELCQGPDVTVTGCASGVGRCQAGVGLELRKERRGVQKWWQERLP